MSRYRTLSFVVLAIVALAVPVLGAAVEGVPGHRAPGKFDLEQAKLERQALVDQLRLEMPARAQVERTRIEVSERERAQISASDEARLRVGVVKTLAEPVRFTGRGTRDVSITPDGGFVWARTIESPGATALRLHFMDVDLAPSAELFIHTERGEAFGPYTGKGPLGSGEFWSHTVAGESVTIQLRQPGAVGAPSAFTLADIGYVDLSRVHGLPQPDPQAGEQLCSFNANCVENANCGGLGIPAAVQTARAAYAHMEFVSGAYLYYCSGGLLADASGSGTPYFLTANHCVKRSGEASSLQAFFQYQIPCNGSCPALYFYNVTPPPYPRTVGATIRSTSSTSDYTLLQLSQPAPASSYFMGWNQTSVANSNGTALYRISHPGGAPQAYSTHTVDTSKPTCTGWPRGAWIYSRDTLGATEGGSSGAPVLNANGQVVGQLSGACGYNTGNVCDVNSNATVDGAFANYYCGGVQQILNPTDTSCGGSGCFPTGTACTSNSQCCSASCNKKTKTCK